MPECQHAHDATDALNTLDAQLYPADAAEQQLLKQFLQQFLQQQLPEQPEQ